MKISIEIKSGFCFGVKRAIALAEERLEQGERVYCLGQIVHNEKEVERLIKKGMIFIEHDDLDKLYDKTVLIRAHGEPPGTYEKAKKNKLRLIDGTCPIVLGLQKKIKKRFSENDLSDSQIIIYGKDNHPEVRGLKGQANNQALVVKSAEEIKKTDFKKKVFLFSQTTMDVKGFNKIESLIKQKVLDNEEGEVEVNNTICRHISHRETGLRDFAREHDLIVFVAGKHSSNGRVLFEICRSENPESYFVTGPEEIQAGWFVGKSSAGISGATSTPEWLLEEVAEKIREFTKN